MREGAVVSVPGGLSLSIHGRWVYTDITVSSSLPSHSAKFSVRTEHFYFLFLRSMSHNADFPDNFKTEMLKEKGKKLSWS